ncbi:MAG TPA: hypothetical protein VLN74_16915 [Ilumatobacteraceae bacterium]|nr:hypothetical protein [Ilumatobacteraceae bacterium]
MTAQTDDGRTSAQRWADDARDALNATGLAGFGKFLADDFVQESRRSAPFEFNRTHVLGSLQTMTQMGLTVDGTDIATAGDRCLLTLRTYRHRTGSVELLAVSVWDDQGHLVRFVEFDADALDDALATLADVSGEPVVRCTDDGERSQ